MSLERLAELLREHNRISSEIASLIGRPAESCHIGTSIKGDMRLLINFRQLE